MFKNQYASYAWYILTVFALLSLSCYAQDEAEDEVHANQLEDLIGDEEEVAENDFDTQQLHFFRQHPLDVNGNNLDQLPLLSAVHISNLQKYRSVLGDIIDLYELQAVPGFTADLIRSIMPYVTVMKEQLSSDNLKKRFTEGNASILLRPVLVPEKANGFNASSSQRFIGSRAAILARYKYQYRDLLQYGAVVDKDAGEPILAKGIAPDFVSFHLYARRLGIVKALAVGDYTVNLGQGMIHWQSQAFRKSASVINIKRQSPVLRPYNSAGEYNFFRGLAFTATRGDVECTGFYSFRKITANIGDDHITSVNTSGLHRTGAEMQDRHAASVTTSGINLKRSMKHGHIGLNVVNISYSLPMNKRDAPYNVFSWKGRNWINMSADYSLTIRNAHFFGEAAIDRKLRVGWINGMMASLSKSVDAALLVRYIERSYQAVNGNAFTENTSPGNETGFYAGLSFNPNVRWKIDVYADMFSFPWLKYRLDAPAFGAAYLIQITYKPNRQTECYSRFRYRMKPLSIEDEEETVHEPGIQVIQQWRNQVSYHLSRSVYIRSRMESIRFSHALLPYSQTGFLFFADLTCKARKLPCSGNIRFQTFAADSYESRLYAFENDLPFSSSIPAFYNNGMRAYTNLSAKIRLNRLKGSVLTTSLKVATTIYKNLTAIGSGVSGITGNRVSSIRMQFLLSR